LNLFRELFGVLYGRIVGVFPNEAELLAANVRGLIQQPAKNDAPRQEDIADRALQLIGDFSHQSPRVDDIFVGRIADCGDEHRWVQGSA